MQYLVQVGADSLEDEIRDLLNVLDKSYMRITSYYVLLDYCISTAVPNDGIPVGTLAFVRKILSKQGYINVLKPIEVPYFLQCEDFLKREYHILKYEDLPKTGRYFVKDVSHLKASNASCISMNNFGEWFEGYAGREGNEYIKANETNFSVSDNMNLLSEYRVLVSDDKVQGVQYYNGDCLVFPDAGLIKEVIKEIEVQRLLGHLLPKSYTLDIGVCDKGSFLIEMHNFVSCGTYGFYGDVLPYMYTEGIDFERDYSKSCKYHLYEREYYERCLA